METKNPGIGLTTSELKKDVNNDGDNDNCNDNCDSDDTTDTNLVNKKWSEISITPPIALLIGSNDEEEVILCPFPSCNGQIGKNKSLDTHLMKNHMKIMIGESQGNGGSSKIIKYFCPQIDCSHSIDADNKGIKKSGSKKGNWFSRFKYVKQHYHKIHLPKDFTCKVCEKCFSTQVYLNIHETMCGKTFKCSCGQSYKSLEALQTHAKRKDHRYDYEKYRDIINSERLKSKLAAEKRLQSETDQNAKSESSDRTLNQLKEPLTSINSIIIVPSHFKTLPPKPISSKSKPNVEVQVQVQNKPNDQYYIRNLLKNDLGTQTIAEESRLIIKIDQQSQTPQNIVNYNSHHQNSKKRKRCTATQTARVRVRVSTDTQTSNIVKRARHSHKKKQPTTDTGIQAAMTFATTTTPTTTTTTPTRPTSSTSKLDLLLPITDYNTTSANSIFDIFPPPSTNTTTTTTTSTTTTNDGDDPTKTLSNFLEDHRHTQTDPDLFFSDLNYFDYDYNFLNFVSTETTETQTLCPSLIANNLDLDSSFTTTLNSSKNIETETSNQDQLFSSTSTSNPISIDDERADPPFYFETIDNETQTYDFSQIISFDNLN